MPDKHSTPSILILTEGGKNIGFGHVTRCLALAQSFLKKGLKPRMVIHGDASLETLLGGADYQFSSWLTSGSLEENLSGVDMVIIDSYLAQPADYERIASKVPCAVFFDDNIRISYPAGVVINGNIYAEALVYPQRKNMTYLLGPQFLALREIFWNASAKDVKENVDEILVTLGGYDMQGLTMPLMKMLAQSFPGCHKTILIGEKNNQTARLSEMADKKTRVYFAPAAQQLKECMLAADLAISAAGQTLGELAGMGVPAIAVKAAENQQNNIAGWERTGFIRTAQGMTKDLLIEDVREKLISLMDKSIRKKASAIGQKIVDGQGCFRVRDELLKHVFFNLQYTKTQITNNTQNDNTQ